MATIVNNPAPSNDSGMGLLVGIMVLVVLGALFYFYGLPYFQSAMQQGASQEIQINVPENVNVNVNQGSDEAAE